MIKLSDILKEITEGKQVGPLYHFTTLPSLLDMLNSNSILTRSYSTPSPYGHENLSFTRNKDLDKANAIFWFRLARNRGDINVRLTFDGDKLANNYHIEPVRDQTFDSDNPNSKWSKTPKVVKKKKKYYSADESEERLITNKSSIPLKDYLLEIKILLDPKDVEEVKEMIPQDFKKYIK